MNARAVNGAGLARQSSEVRLPNAVADLIVREIRFRDGLRYRLTPTETELLGYLADRAGEIVSRAELLGGVWHLNPSCTCTRTVDIHIGKLRRKLRDDPGKPFLILTLRGCGYMFLGAVGVCPDIS